MICTTFSAHQRYEIPLSRDCFLRVVGRRVPIAADNVASASSRCASTIRICTAGVFGRMRRNRCKVAREIAVGCSMSHSGLREDVRAFALRAGFYLCNIRQRNVCAFFIGYFEKSPSRAARCIFARRQFFNALPFARDVKRRET